MALHSIHNDNTKVRVACGLPMVPFRSKENSNFTLTVDNSGKMDIIDEAFTYFRVNVLFKNFEIKGVGDRVLIYSKDANQANKRLSQIMSAGNALPKQKSNFLSFMLQDGSGVEREAYLQYIKQIKSEVIRRFLQRFYHEGIVVQDFKFWMGLAKKKFMGLNYTSAF